ncbi:MAG: NADH-quinone oxidoreductase subunit K [Gammaproteobacteria bacterium RIFCSPHIGHO2_12_FULL_42_13]|nr:MAG: NADH-quinone oxidoreductase subunit K [Gammaproteobacteria bacterium RIFCSPHIGHO2_12_FULL_42_13]
MITLHHYLIIGLILFALSLTGMIINRRNVIMLLMCVELLLLAVNTNFVAFAQYFGDTSGEIFVFFILTVAAVEAAIGLAILVLLYRRRGSIDVEEMRTLKG